MSDVITVIVGRPLHWMGNLVTAGTTLKVDALQAQHLLDSGRATLVHKADAAQLKEAVHADVRRALKAERGGQINPPDNWPWQRFG